MSVAYGLGAAAAAAACGWPAAAAIDQLSRRPADAIGAAGAASHGGERRADAAPRTAVDCLLICLLLAGLAFAVAARVHPAIVAAAGCWLVACGVPLAVIDVRIGRLPDVLTGASLAGLAALLAAAAASNAGFYALGRAGAGGLAVGSLFGLLAVARPGSAGLGDAKLGLSTGAMAGWLGWGPLLASVFGAFVLAAVAGLWLVGTRRARLRGGSLPFGPFLLAGCLVAVLLSG